jgi:dolichyl-diphosphooligosaccharide--protein glycosyltransferase
VHPPEAQKRRSGRRVRSGTSAPDFKAYQPVAVIAVGLLVLPGLVLSANPTAPYWVVVGEMRPDSSTVLWDIASEWVANNTPAVPLDFKTAYPFQNAGNFHYPNGTYGILAWWDYGHQIEIFGNRPPVANDFQQAAPFASLFFTDTHEWETEPAMAKWTGGDAYKIRYVMISDQDANGKYGAITVWANLNNESRHQFEQGQTVSTGCFTGATIVSRACTSSDTSAGGHSVQLLGPEYRNSMMYRLYYENGDDLAHYRMVYAYPGWNCYGTYIDSSGNLVTFNDQLLQGPCNGQGLAPQTLSRSSSNVQGGGSGQPLIYDFVDEPSLKIFEHVRGVTLLGNATPGTSVTASLALHLPWSASNIPINESYTQTVTTPSNGTWVMTVPYSTCSATKACLTPAENGTTLQVTTGAAYTITAGSSIFNASVTDRQVIYGAKMWVS